MKRIRKWLIRIGLGLLVIVIMIAIAGIWFVRRSLPEVSGTLVVEGLSAPVQVIRDQRGVPYIYAQNEHDLFLAQGYVHAQDRLWQMEMERRTSSGTLSELVGGATLGVDSYVRTLGLRRVAEQSWAMVDDETRTIFQAYADGVNAYIQSHRDRLPVEFTLLGDDPQPWTPVDSIAWANMVALNMSLNFRDEALEAGVVQVLGEKARADLFARPGQASPVIIPPGLKYSNELRNADYVKIAAIDEWLANPFAPWGSNNWVVSGSRTATGKPMLANDTHLDLQMPSVWYENGVSGGRFNSVGFTFPGVPLVVIGHNQRIAWGLTNLDPDVQDLYFEQLDDPANPTKYMFKGEWHTLSVIHDTIPIRGGSPVPLDILLTNHGPLINNVFLGSDAPPTTLRWNLFEGTTVPKSLVQLNLAQNWDQFHSALQYWDTLSQNFVYADVDGNIGYQTAARVPIRGPNHTGLVPVPGWTGDYEWQGYIPYDQLPHILNPPTGFIVTANNRVVDDYPYQLDMEWYPGLRAKRINSLLAGNDHVTLDDMRAIQNDTYTLDAETLRPYLLTIKPANSLEAQALDKVRTWNLRLDRDSIGGAVYETWFWFLVQDTLGDELDQLPPVQKQNYLYYYALREILLLEKILPDANNPWFDNVKTPQTETRDDILRQSLTDTVNFLSQRFGNDPNSWQWGKLHQTTFVHSPLGQSGIAPLESLFNSPTISTPGGDFTVNEGFYAGDVPSFNVFHGTAQRLIMDLSDWDNSLAVNTTGQSGQLLSPHRTDDIDRWQNGEYDSLYFSSDKIKANAEAVLTLMPPQK